MQRSDVRLYKDFRIIADGDEFVLTSRSARELACCAIITQAQLENSHRWLTFIEQIASVLREMERRGRPLTQEPIDAALDTAHKELQEEGII